MLYRYINQFLEYCRLADFSERLLIPTLFLREHADCFNVKRKLPQCFNLIRLRFKRSHDHSFSIRYC